MTPLRALGLLTDHAGSRRLHRTHRHRWPERSPELLDQITPDLVLMDASHAWNEWVRELSADEAGEDALQPARDFLSVLSESSSCRGGLASGRVDYVTQARSSSMSCCLAVRERISTRALRGALARSLMPPATSAGDRTALEDSVVHAARRSSSWLTRHWRVISGSTRSVAELEGSSQARSVLADGAAADRDRGGQCHYGPDEWLPELPIAAGRSTKRFCRSRWLSARARIGSVAVDESRQVRNREIGEILHYQPSARWISTLLRRTRSWG